MASTDDGTVEGYGALAEEEMVEGEGRFGRWKMSGRAARAGGCVAADDGDQEEHVGVKEGQREDWWG